MRKKNISIEKSEYFNDWKQIKKKREREREEKGERESKTKL